MEPQAEGGAAEKLVALDKEFSTVVGALTQADIPDEAKQAFGSALEAWRGGLEILMSGEGGTPEGPQPTTPEQGGNPNAVPMNPGRR